MKKSELKYLIKECIREWVSENGSSGPFTPEGKAWQQWVDSNFKSEIKFNEYQPEGNISIEFYKYNYATAQLSINPRNNKIVLEKYYDSEFLDEEYGMVKKYTMDQSEQAKKDFIIAVKSIKKEPLSDQG